MEPSVNSSERSNNGEAKNFMQFDVITEKPVDHRYGFSNNTTTSTVFHKSIMKEWKNLQKNLPESIYVRVYEQRIDLLSAVIIGASGTPYHDVLFFFDFKFPPSFPENPPLVYYRSSGLRLNPNLYADGFVCLSILNTFVGPKWDPNGSTILQVLVSLQGLVLTEKPFFNGPVLGGFKGKMFDKSSRHYDNSVFVMCCKASMFLLRNPPKNFEEFVVEHFRERGRVILTACKAYTNGFVRVGQYKDGEAFLPERVKVSKRFLEFMNVQYPLLVNAFAKNDSSLNDFLVQLDRMVDKTNEEYTEKAKAEKKKKLMNKFTGILKKYLGCNRQQE